MQILSSMPRLKGFRFPREVVAYACVDVCGCPLFGKRNLRFVGGVFDRTCVRPLSVAFMTPRAGMLFGRPGSHRFRELQALEPRV